MTFSRNALLSWGANTSSVFLPHVLGPDGKPLDSDAKVHTVRENFLTTMEIPLLVGRNLTEQDDARAPRVAVVNQAFAKAHFANESPIGKCFSFDPEKPSEIEIVGIARDAKYTSQRDDDRTYRLPILAAVAAKEPQGLCLKCAPPAIPRR